MNGYEPDRRTLSLEKPRVKYFVSGIYWGNHELKWDNKDTWKSSPFGHLIEDDDNWRYIENHETLQNRTGVYLFADANLQIKYVGKAGARRMLAEIENAIQRGKNSGATLVKAIYTGSGEQAQELETYLIRKYAPLNNMTF